MKLSAKLFSIFVSISILLSLFVYTVSATSTTLYFSSNEVKTGNSVTVSVKVSADDEMNALKFNLSFDNAILKYEGTEGTLNGNVISFEAKPSSKTASYNFTFTAITGGKSRIQVSNCVYSNTSVIDDSAKSFEGASAIMKVSGESVSSNAKLKSLSVDGYTISPSFSSDKTSYNIEVPNDVTNVKVSAKAQDNAAKCEIKGGSNLAVGNNDVIITVTAPDKTKKTYKIKVKRLEKTADSSETTDSDENLPQSFDTLETNIDNVPYLILTTLPKDILFDGFTAQKTQINGYELEAAFDENKNFRIFYLKALDSEALIPFFYDENTDRFEKVEYFISGKNEYIFSDIPQELNDISSLFASSVKIGDQIVECYTSTDSDFSDFHYVYAFSNGSFSLYRYDEVEETLQRYPQSLLTTSNVQKDNLLTRFSSLSTNGKVIMIALAVVIIGVFALLILLIVYLIRRAVNPPQDILLEDDDDEDDDFEEIEVKNNDYTIK